MTTEVDHLDLASVIVIETATVIDQIDTALLVTDMNGMVTGTFHLCFAHMHSTLPYLTLLSGWAGYYTCPALRPYQFGPMRNPDVTKGHSDRL